jgi:hypothetical protein
MLFSSFVVFYAGSLAVIPAKAGIHISTADEFVKVFPIEVLFFDKSHLPSSIPFLYVLLASNCILDIIKYFEVNINKPTHRPLVIWLLDGANACDNHPSCESGEPSCNLPSAVLAVEPWIPASAGMTIESSSLRAHRFSLGCRPLLRRGADGDGTVTGGFDRRFHPLLLGSVSAALSET